MQSITYASMPNAQAMYENLLEQESHYADLINESEFDLSGEYPMPAFRDVPEMEEGQRSLRCQIQAYTDDIYEMRDLMEEDESVESIDWEKMNDASEGWQLYEADCHTPPMLDWLRMVGGVTLLKVQDEKGLLWAGLSAPNGFCLGLVYGFVEIWPLCEGEKIMLMHKIVSHRKDIDECLFETGEAVGWVMCKYRGRLEASQP